MFHGRRAQLRVCPTQNARKASCQRSRMPLSLIAKSKAQRRNLRQIEARSEWLWRASPGPWCSSDKAFSMRSSRLPARAEALGSLDDKSGVDVVDSSIAGAAIQALSRPGAASSSVNRSRATRSRYELHKGSAVEIRCVLHLPATFFLPHFSATSLLAGSCLY